MISKIEWTTGIGPDGKPITAKVAWPWFTLIGTTATLGIAWVARLFTVRPLVSPKETSP